MGNNNAGRKEEVSGVQFTVLTRPRMTIKNLIQICHNRSMDRGWWESTLENPLEICTKLCLIHSEVSEAMEGYRKGLMDDKLPNRSMIEVELADAIIRICDLAGFLKLDLSGAIEEKLKFNLTRKDHDAKVREERHGKRF